MCKAHDAAEAWYKSRKKARQAKAANRRTKNGRFAGFATYRQYLNSDLWKSIRERVFLEHGSKCHLCQREASQVHHRHYGRRTLCGKTLFHLLPVCGKCHRDIEFGPNGKRKFAEAEFWLSNRLKELRQNPTETH
jgi:5-methylcytosine-specific restriction endonuclease McrA